MMAAEDQAVWAKIQESLFLRMMRLCFLGHPYYQQILREKGLKLADFRSLQDLSLLPLTHKKDFMAEPERFRLRVEGEARAEEQTWSYLIYTAGSTAKPTPFYDTTHDHFSPYQPDETSL